MVPEMVTEFLKCAVCGKLTPSSSFDPSGYPTELKVVYMEVGGSGGGARTVGEEAAASGDLLETYKRRFIEVLPGLGIDSQESLDAFQADVSERAAAMVKDIEEELEEDSENWEVEDLEDPLSILETGVARLIEDAGASAAGAAESGEE